LTAPSGTKHDRLRQAQPPQILGASVRQQHLVHPRGQHYVQVTNSRCRAVFQYPSPPPPHTAVLSPQPAIKRAGMLVPYLESTTLRPSKLQSITVHNSSKTASYSRHNPPMSSHTPSVFIFLFRQFSATGLEGVER